MTENIKSILLNFIENPIIVASWGISEINVNHDSISFAVSAIKYVGKVIIEDNDTSVSIKLNNANFYTSNITIVTTAIDDLIENGPNYSRELRKWVIDNV